MNEWKTLNHSHQNHWEHFGDFNNNEWMNEWKNLLFPTQDHNYIYFRDMLKTTYPLLLTTLALPSNIFLCSSLCFLTHFLLVFFFSPNKRLSLKSKLFESHAFHPPIWGVYIYTFIEVMAPKRHMDFNTRYIHRLPYLTLGVIEYVHTHKCCI